METQYNSEYLESVRKWKTPQDVLKYIETFSYASEFLPDTKRNLQLYKIYHPKMLDLDTLYKTRRGTCTNVYYFFVKTVNTIDPSYAAFAITMTWRGPWSGVNKICFWFEDFKVKSFRWTPQDGGKLVLDEPFSSLESARDFYISMAKESLKPKEIPIKYGISILDIRVLRDLKIQHALEVFGIDDGYSIYRKF